MVEGIDFAGQALRYILIGGAAGLVLMVVWAVLVWKGIAVPR